MDNFILLALIASDEAIENSGYVPKNELESSRTGVIIGSGIGGLSTIYNNSILLHISSYYSYIRHCYFSSSYSINRSFYNLIDIFILISLLL